MSGNSDTELSRSQLAKHIAGALPFGLLLGFLAGSIVFVLSQSVLYYGRTPMEFPETIETLFTAMGAWVSLLAGISVTGFWVYHAKDISTGIRLSEIYEEDAE